MSQSQIRAEFGAWVESDVRKVNGKGFRKVWTSPAPTGEALKLSVIRTGERGDAHMLTLDVSTPERIIDAGEALSFAIDALTAPKATEAPKPARKPTQTPPAAPTQAPTPKAPATVTDAARDPKQTPPARKAIIAKARAERAALSVAPTPRVSNPAPVRDQGADMLDWLDAIRA